MPPRGVAGPSLAQPGLALSGRPRSPLLSPPCLLQARDFLLEEQARGPRLISFPAEIPRAPGSESQGAALALSTCVLPGPSSSMRWGHGEPPRGQVEVDSQPRVGHCPALVCPPRSEPGGVFCPTRQTGRKAVTSCSAAESPGPRQRRARVLWQLGARLWQTRVPGFSFPCVWSVNVPVQGSPLSGVQRST